MPACYILYSPSQDRYYIGATHENHVSARLQKHNEKFYGSHAATVYTNDWLIYLCIECASYPQAINIERHIKKMKSKIYLNNLKKYPEMVQRLIEKYSRST